MRPEVLAQHKSDRTGLGGVLRTSFLTSREKPGFGALEAIVFAAYAALLAWTVAHHVPWVDEAQGWLVARDSSLIEIFRTRLHYEGAPGLWHLLLWFLARVGVSFTAMRWITAVIPVAGIWVFLRYSPFPGIVRVILPFSFYLMYQYAAVSRNYILAPLLIFIIAVLFSNPARNLLSLAVVMGLLSNLSAQGLVLSAGFALMIALRLWQSRKQGGQSVSWGRITGATICLCAFWAFSVWSTRPVADDSYKTAWAITHGAGGAGSSKSAPGASAGDESAVSSQATSSLRNHSAVRHAFERFETNVTYGLSNFWPASLAIWCIVAAYLFFRKSILDIAPLILLQLLFEFVAARPWHLGMAFLGFIAVLWIDWPREGDRSEPAWRAILSAALLAVAAEQCFWTARAIRTDVTGRYSGDKDAAAFLAPRIAGKTVAGFQYYSVGILPYFPSNIYANQPKQAFWFWTKYVHVDDRVMETVQSHPDYIVVGFAVRAPDATGGSGAPTGDPQTFQPRIEREILATHKYAETHRFCGDAFSGHGYHEGLCQAILEPSAQ